MFVRVKTKGPYRYLQIVENHREGQRTLQRVLATLGRADELAESGGVDVLLKSLGRFATRVRVIQGYEAGRLEAGALRHIGLDLVFGRLWKDLGLDTALNRLLEDRGFEFPVERAVYLTVLHRLLESGSDRAGDRWRRDVQVDGSDGLKLHHLFGPGAGWETAGPRWKRPCFSGAATCSRSAPWPFSTPPASILKAGAGRAWANSASPRTSGRTVAS